MFWDVLPPKKTFNILLEADFECILTKCELHQMGFGGVRFEEKKNDIISFFWLKQMRKKVAHMHARHFWHVQSWM